MRKSMIFILTGSAIAFAGVAAKLKSTSDPNCLSFQANRALAVNALIEAPQCVHGSVEVEGTVNSILKDRRSLVLIDLSEKDNCEDECPIRRLPVSWSGEMPKRGAAIVVKGEVLKQDNKLIFAAQALRMIPGATKQ